MNTLLLAFHGAMQSWGTRSKLSVRDTFDEPTRSAVLGLIRSSLGDPRDGDQELSQRLDELTLTVRTDRPGRPIRDLHNTTPIPRPVARTTAGDHDKNIMSHRWYLSDAAFLVAINGPAPLIVDIAAAVDEPAWHLAMGRRSCPPTAPFLLGVFDADPLDLMEAAPALGGDGLNLRVSVESARAAACAERGWRTVGSSSEPTRPLAGYRRYDRERRHRFTLPVPVPALGLVATGNWAVDNRAETFA